MHTTERYPYFLDAFRRLVETRSGLHWYDAPAICWRGVDISAAAELMLRQYGEAGRPAMADLDMGELQRLAAIYIAEAESRDSVYEAKRDAQYRAFDAAASGRRSTVWAWIAAAVGL